MSFKVRLFDTYGASYDTRSTEDILGKELAVLYAAQTGIHDDKELDDDAADEKLGLVADAIHESILRAAIRGCSNLAQIDKNAQKPTSPLESNQKFLN